MKLVLEIKYIFSRDQDVVNVVLKFKLNMFFLNQTVVNAVLKQKYLFLSWSRRSERSSNKEKEGCHDYEFS